MRKTVRVAGELIEEAFFTNGERHYEVTEGLEKGYKLVGIMRAPNDPRDWLFIFDDNEKETDSEITPVIRTIRSESS